VEHPAAATPETGPAAVARAAAEADDAYRRGALDLLGVIAYGALAAFDRLSEDARLAPTLPDKLHMARMAARQVSHVDQVRDRLAQFDLDVVVAMRPFHEAFNGFHDHTRPKDWLEGLVKAYVGDGIAADFYREVAAFVDADTRALVHEVLADEVPGEGASGEGVPVEGGHADFVVARIRDAIAADARVAGRLALWSRRLVGEALSQAHRVAAEREALTSLLTGTVDRPGRDLAAVSRLFSRLTENHTRRMAALGLQA